MKKKILLCAAAAVLACLLATTAFAADKSVGYIVRGDLNSATNIYTVDILISNVNAVAGSFALDYDETKLELLNGDSSIQGAVVAGAGVTISPDGHLLSEIVSDTEGFVYFAWWPSQSRLDSRSEPKTIGKMQFALKPGVATADFDCETLQMKYMESGNALSSTGAAICEEGLVYYKNNEDNANPLNLVFDYAGSNKSAADAQSVTLQVCDSANAPIGGATATVGTKKHVADANGNILLELTAGNYKYTIAANNYETKFGTLSIGSQNHESIVLRSKMQLVQDVAQKLEIGFFKGDSAQSVTRGLRLETMGENNTKIAWTSSNPSVVTDIGSVFPAKDATNVTLTAKVGKDGMIATKTFDVHVLAKSQTPDSGANPEQPGEAKGFTDISSVPWAKDAIESLAELGVIKGVSATEFAPSGNIRRGDFIAMLMRMLPFNGTNSGQFTDVAAGSYYYNEIALAKSLGIANGYQDGSYHPNESISRQDMMLITHRALVLNKSMSVAGTEIKLGQFKDGASVAEYAQSAVSAVVEAGLITGDNAQNLNPEGNTTRAETAVFLYRVYSKFIQ